MVGRVSINCGCRHCLGHYCSFLLCNGRVVDAVPRDFYTAILNHYTDGLVVRWVATSEYPLSYVFAVPFASGCDVERARESF